MRSPEFVVSRIAQKNPQINGQKLYLTSIGMWTLDASLACRFLDYEEAKRCGGGHNINVERA